MGLFKKKKIKTTAPQPSPEIPVGHIAAIAAAIFDISQNAGDSESGILTIRPCNQPYSPWNSKDQMMLRMPH